MVESPGAVGRTRIKLSHPYDCLSGAGQCCSLGICRGGLPFCSALCGDMSMGFVSFCPCKKMAV